MGVPLPAQTGAGAELPTRCPVCRAVSVVQPDDRGMVYGCGARYGRASDSEPWTGTCGSYDEELWAAGEAVKAERALEAQVAEEIRARAGG